MIAIQEFISRIENEFEELKKGSLTPDSVIKEHFSMDSISALMFIAHVNVEYGVVINAEDLVKSKTVKDLYYIVNSRK